MSTQKLLFLINFGMCTRNITQVRGTYILYIMVKRNSRPSSQPFIEGCDLRGNIQAELNHPLCGDDHHTGEIKSPRVSKRMWRFLTVVSIFCALRTCTAFEAKKHWAVLVAGSSGYGNYRHQA